MYGSLHAHGIEGIDEGTEAGVNLPRVGIEAALLPPHVSDEGDADEVPAKILECCLHGTVIDDDCGKG